MQTSSSLRFVAAAMACGLVMAACGQKPGVRVGADGLAAGAQVPAAGQDTGSVPVASGDSAAGDASAPTTDTTGDTSGAQPNAGGAQTDTSGQTDSGTSSGQADAGTGGGQADAGNDGGQADAGNNGGQGDAGQTDNGNDGGQNDTGNDQQNPGASGQVIGNDRTGAPDDRIVIGLHAPATGAAPLPTTSFEQARDTYWRHVIDTKGQAVLGRQRVEVLFQDDKYDPNSAGQVCQRLAAEAFVVVGGGGTDQVQRCGQLAAVNGFPYFSAGVTEAGLSGNEWYFAASMTYRQQGGLLAQWIKKNPNQVEDLNSPKIGVIITDTANFKDAEDGFLKGLSDNGLSLAKLSNGQDAIFRHTKNDTSWINGVARDFSEAGINTVYFLSAPTVYLDFVNAADSTFSYNPTYVGVGVSKGLNAVLRGGCKAPGKRDDNGYFLSPLPGLDRAPKDFIDASDKFNAPADDIALALWGLAEGQHKMFQAYEARYGDDLERQTFRQFVENEMGTIQTTVYPSVTYAPGEMGHFGAAGAYVLEANCETKKYDTAQGLSVGF